MNYLSHFYFDRNSNDSHLVLGTVLPDLVKNAKKEWTLHPEKHSESFNQPDEFAILTGWKRHLAVDRHFHSSAFFYEHTRAIRTGVAPVLQNSPIRPSFLAHISLELMLDSILLIQNIINADDLYAHLRNSNQESLHSFLQKNQISDTAPFFSFLNEFIDASYLNTYREAHNIIYALGKICMRIWDEPLNETQKLQLSAFLLNYNEDLLADYQRIFDEIENQLKT